MTYEYIIIVINGGKKAKVDLFMMIDVFLMNDRIDQIQYNDLAKRINEKYPE